MDRRIIPGLTLIAVILAGACGTPKSSLTSADFPDRAKRIKKVGVVVAEARIMNLAAGGGAALSPEASERCSSCAAEAATKLLGQRGYEAADNAPGISFSVIFARPAFFEHFYPTLLVITDNALK